MTGYAAGRPLPPRSEWVPRIFRRDGIFYVIDLPVDDDLAEPARLNPGTRQIEDADGKILWKEEGDLPCR